MDTMPYRSSQKLAKLIPDAEWAEIRASATAAEEIWLEKIVEKSVARFNKLKRPLTENVLQNASVLPLSAYFCTPLSAYSEREIAAQNYLLGAMLRKEKRSLTGDDAWRVLSNAATADDFGFFIRLGRVLGEEPFDMHSTNFEPLIKLLIYDWVGRRVIREGFDVTLRYSRSRTLNRANDATPLCFFTDTAITQYCALKLGYVRANKPLASVVAENHQAWTRLRNRVLQLKPASKKLIRSVSMKSGRLQYEVIVRNTGG